VTDTLRRTRPTHRWTAVAVVGICAVAALGPIRATSALAARTEISTITEVNGHHFIDPDGLSVDSSDNLWVSDVHPEGVIEKFNSSGSALAESSGTPWSGEYIESVAFSNAANHLYVADSNFDDVWGLEPSGAYANIDLTGPWGSGCCYIRVAADNSGGATGGDLYLSADAPGSEHSIYRIGAAGAEVPFSASAPYISGNRLTGFGPEESESFSEPIGLAVDPGGNVYVADKGRDAVYEFEPSGEFLRSFTVAEEGRPFGSVSAVAIDPSNGHVLIADRIDGVIDEFDSTGVYLDNIEEVGAPQGLVVDSTGKLYVADAASAAVHVLGAYTAPTHLPKIIPGSLSSVAASVATLNATVNPKGGGEVSECRFEYGASESYGESIPCVPDTFSSQTAVSGQLSGLLPDSTYHYRLHVVDPTTGPAGADGLDGTFATNPALAGPPASGCANPARTGLSGRLPDCRAYELLTPANKGNAEDMFGDFGEQSVNGGSYDLGYPDAEGDKFFLTTLAAFGPLPAAGQNGYVFSRGTAGWQQSSLASPTAGVQSIDPESLLSPDFSHVATRPTLGSNDNQEAATKPGLVGSPGGPYSTLFEGVASTFVGASTDFSRVFFQSSEHRFVAPAEEQLSGSKALYEYSGGRYSLVNVDSNGKLLNTCGAVSPAEATHTVSVYGHAVSADGARVFFLSPDPTDSNCYEESESGFSGTPPQLYLRSGGRTIEVSAPSGFTDPAGPQPVAFAGASADGGHVFFITRGELTPDDAGNHAPELYEYDVETEKLTRISSGASHNASGDAGWVIPSEDGSTVYFTAAGRLAAGAPALPSGGGEAGEYNLYHYDSRTATTTYIATVSGHDWNRADPGGYTSLNVRHPLNARSSWEATPDGRYLLFAAVENVTGYDNHDPTGHCEGNLSGTGGNGSCGEVYRYDADTGSLLCMSCNPSGAAPSANSQFDRSTHNREVRAISDNGAYVFFDTTESLVPAATNGRLDVYEWHEGKLSLISSGQDASSSYFLGTDASGADVFFGTHERLAPQDTDSAGDLYDARINGGFPAPQGSASACEGDTCQSPPAAPSDAPPVSLTFFGAGNLQSPLTTPVVVKCKKGFVKRKNRCVKRKPKRKPTRARKAGHNGRAK
jgi:hypothetical protein